jgi:rubrerythrin
MATGTMKIGDILKYSIRIENESMIFYRKALGIVKEESVKDLLRDLAEEELRHKNHLSSLVDDAGNTDVDFDMNNLNRLIQNSDIPEDVSEMEVLKIAREREEHTRDFYSQIMTLTNLDADVVGVFQMLYDQERGHVKRIGILLTKLSAE